MSKENLKTEIGAKQNGQCALTGAQLPDEFELMDTDRRLERFQGGTYTEDNTRIVLPRAHMERHGTLREREEWLETLKAYMDDRQQSMKLLMKIENQLRAYRRRTDELHPETEAFLNESTAPVQARLKVLDAAIAKHIKASDDPLVHSALGVVGLGPITIAGLMTYVDLAKADSASALWKYTGLHTSSQHRYEKGVAGSGGNKTLRMIMWNAANSIMKNPKSPYRAVYDATKQRLEKSDRLVESRNTQGRLVIVPWSETKPSHRHGAALRAVMKHILADYWMVGRTLRGLPTRPLYVEQIMQHDGVVQPAERGWKY